MGNTEIVQVVLVSPWGEFCEGDKLGVYESELFDLDQIENKYDFVEVETDYNEIMYIRKELVDELSMRFAWMI